MNEISMKLLDDMQALVKDQLKQNSPPETTQAYNRLIKDGLAESEAVAQLAQAATAEMVEVLRTNRPFNHERYISRLSNLKAA